MGDNAESIDGDFGSYTKAFRSLSGLGGVKVDGIVGDYSWSVSLHSASATLKTAVGLNFIIG